MSRRPFTYIASGVNAPSPSCLFLPPSSSLFLSLLPLQTGDETFLLSVPFPFERPCVNFRSRRARRKRGDDTRTTRVWPDGTLFTSPRASRPSPATLHESNPSPPTTAATATTATAAATTHTTGVLCLARVYHRPWLRLAKGKKGERRNYRRRRRRRHRRHHHLLRHRRHLLRCRRRHLRRRRRRRCRRFYNQY